MGSKFIIYGLVDPRNGQLRYIGKSTSGLRRPQEHSHPSRLKKNTHKINWILQLRSLGLKPIITVLQEFGETDILYQAEHFGISYFRQLGMPLTNLADGGPGSTGATWVHTDESKKNMSIARKGKGIPNQYDLGAIMSEETKRKISLAHIGVRSRVGVTLSVETRRKISVNNGGRAFVDQSGNRYHTLREAARALEIDASGILKVLKGKRHSIGGYTFVYSE